MTWEGHVLNLSLTTTLAFYFVIVKLTLRLLNLSFQNRYLTIKEPERDCCYLKETNFKIKTEPRLFISSYHSNSSRASLKAGLISQDHFPLLSHFFENSSLNTNQLRESSNSKSNFLHICLSLSFSIAFSSWSSGRIHLESIQVDVSDLRVWIK